MRLLQSQLNFEVRWLDHVLRKFLNLWWKYRVNPGRPWLVEYWDSDLKVEHQVARDIRQIEKELSSLPHKERALLARVLIDSLDDAPDEDVLSAWVEEAHSRYAAYRRGEMPSESYEEAFSKARNSLRE